MVDKITATTKKYHSMNDLSFWSLLLVNLITSYFTLKNGWGFFTAMLIIWSQSEIIGLFSFARILELKKISPSAFDKTRKVRTDIAITYLFPQSMYLIMILVLHYIASDVAGEQIHWDSLFYVAIGFFVNHLFSYLYNRPEAINEKYLVALLNVSTKRILPMHFTIMVAIASVIFFGPTIFSSYWLVLFLLTTKTIVDVVMHAKEHKQAQKYMI